MKEPAAILVADRFRPLRECLQALLAELRDEEWQLQTAAPSWSIKDVVAHLLGGDVAVLSGKRDGFRSSQVIQSEEQLIATVDSLNAEWITALKRMSPRLLRDLLDVTGPEVESCFASLDPWAKGGAVSWAGPTAAPIWFDVAREFTERWHHQQQIRDAASRPPLYDSRLLGPVLDTFMRALPYTFRNLYVAEGTSVRVEILGEAGGVWFVYKCDLGWTLLLDSPVKEVASAAITQDIAWRLFTKGLDREKARSMAVISGDASLVAPLFWTTCVIG